jgi:hypothetical protein
LLKVVDETYALAIGHIHGQAFLVNQSEVCRSRGKGRMEIVEMLLDLCLICGIELSIIFLKKLFITRGSRSLFSLVV